MNMQAIRSMALTTALLMAGAAAANNLTVQNVSLSPSGGGKAVVAFDLSWENSWRDVENFDAAWVFVKYSTDAGTRWRHATLAAEGTNPAGFSVGTNTILEIVVPADKKGALVQRALEGAGDVVTTGMAFVWDFAADGVAANAEPRVKVMGLEMVYIPGGAFYAGDSLANRKQLMCTYINSPDMNALYASGSGTVEDPYMNPAGCGRPGGVTGTYASGYPNGYSPYYIMKYELTEGLYVDMLNMLPLEQALSRYTDMNGRTRQTIAGGFDREKGTFTTDAPERPVTFYLLWNAWRDAAAVVDWAALRPATELEFEKAGRGPLAPVNAGYAWGTSDQATKVTGFADAGTADESPLPVAANANYGTAGAIRSGAFATNGSDRVKSGGGYYGVMELSGNVIDRVISSGATERTGAAQATSFAGLHGDGELDTTGNADVSGWPVNGDHYVGKAGGFNSAVTDLPLSVRWTWIYMYQDGQGGVRAARTAP